MTKPNQPAEQEWPIWLQETHPELDKLLYEYRQVCFDNQALNYDRWKVEKKMVAHLEAVKREGMEQAKSRVLRRTEIPKDARNPTRDAIVILGEEIAAIIDEDIANVISKS